MTNNKINIIFPSSTRFSLPSYIIPSYTQHRNLSTQYTPIHAQILTQEPPSKPRVEKTRPPSFPPSIYHCTKRERFHETIQPSPHHRWSTIECLCRRRDYHPPTNVSWIHVNQSAVSKRVARIHCDGRWRDKKSDF